MNRTELVAAVADKCGMTKKDAEKAVCATVQAIKESVAAGNKVQIIGFGTFEGRKRQARKGRNPRKPGVVIDIPAAVIPTFKAGKGFKELLNVKKSAKKGKKK